MNIDQAIEILSPVAFGHAVTLNTEFYGAVKLGIEALKSEKGNRERGVYLRDELLPGETTE